MQNNYELGRVIQYVYSIQIFPVSRKGLTLFLNITVNLLPKITLSSAKMQSNCFLT